MNQRIPKTNHPKSKETQELADQFPDIIQCTFCGAINEYIPNMRSQKCVRCTKEITSRLIVSNADKLSYFFIKQRTPSITQLVFQWLHKKTLHTKRPYLSRMKTFVEYCSLNTLDPLKLDVEDLQTYFQYRATYVNPTTAREEVFTTLKSFYSYLYSNNLIEFHPVKDKTIQVPLEDGGYRQKTIKINTKLDTNTTDMKKQSSAITAPTFEMALNFCLKPISMFNWQGDPRDFGKDTMYKYRDGMLMLSLLGFGLRRKDPVLIKWSNVDLNDCLIYIEGRKNNRQTWIPIPRFLLPFFDYYKLCVSRRPSWRKNQQLFLISNEKTVTLRINQYFEEWFELKNYNDFEIDKLNCADFRKKLLKQQNAVYFMKRPMIPFVFRRGEEKFIQIKPHGLFRKTWYTFIGLLLNPIVRNYLMGHSVSRDSSTKSSMNNLVSTYAGFKEYAMHELKPIIDSIWDKISQKFDPAIIQTRDNIIRQIKILRLAFNLSSKDLEARYYSSSSRKLCTYCGAVISRDSNFCSECGESQESTIIEID